MNDLATATRRAIVFVTLLSAFYFAGTVYLYLFMDSLASGFERAVAFVSNPNTPPDSVRRFSVALLEEQRGLLQILRGILIASISYFMILFIFGVAIFWERRTSKGRT